MGPRAGIIIWWLLDPVRWNLAFSTVLVPILGFLFLPWTTIMYVLVFAGGIDGFDWVWLGLGLVADVLSYGGGAYGNRERMGYT
ncbi:MAG: hypothetical protein ACJ761_00105 [Chloroflexota bacterium]